MLLKLQKNVLCVNPSHHQMVRFVWGCFNRCEKWSWLDCLSFCSKSCFVLTLYCHQMVIFVWGCFYQPELCPKMVAHVLIVCEKSKFFKVWHSFVTKQYRQNMFIGLKAINIIRFQSLAVFWKKSFLLFNMHFLSVTLENETFTTDENDESFCVCSYVCWELCFYLDVSHRVFEFIALFCHVKDKHWEQFLEICGVIFGEEINSSTL